MNYTTRKQPSSAADTSLRPHTSIRATSSTSSSTRLAMGEPNRCLRPFALRSCSVLGKHRRRTSCISWPRTRKLLGNHSNNCQKDGTTLFLDTSLSTLLKICAICHFICTAATALPLDSGTLFFPVLSAQLATFYCAVAFS